METRGTLKDIGITYPSHRAVITLEVTATPEDCEKYKGKDLTITVKQYREKRSLNANSYFYVLVAKIAEKVHRSTVYVHNQMISNYGQYEIQELPNRKGEPEKQVTHIILRDDIDAMELESIHLQMTTAVKELDDGKLYRVYRVMRGSHTYNTVEMARLIDGTVQEAKDLGIETMTPDELSKLKASWEQR